MSNERQHRRASYLKGCRCPDCRAANATYYRDARSRRRYAAGADLPCLWYGAWFHTFRGLHTHETMVCERRAAS